MKSILCFDSVVISMGSPKSTVSIKELCKRNDQQDREYNSMQELFLYSHDHFPFDKKESIGKINIF
jgi:hypothetical protein